MKPQVNPHKSGLQPQLLYLRCISNAFKHFWHSADCHKGNVWNVQTCTQKNNCRKKALAILQLNTSLAHGVFRSSFLTLQIILYKHLQMSSSSSVNRSGMREGGEEFEVPLSLKSPIPFNKQELLHH